MSAYGTKVAEAFSQKLLLEAYERALTPEITNQDYEGEINMRGSKVNILNFDRVAEKTYTGANLTVDDLTENNIVLTIDQYKSFYWREKTLDRWLSYIKNPHATIVEQTGNERAKNMDEYVLGLFADVGAGNRVGTDYTTGTVEVAVTTGVVTGSSTTFTSGMVGRGFKADGHTQWYRVKTYTSATSITIEDDKDDATSAYTGGAISAGATYTIEANTTLAVTTSNFLTSFVAPLREKLDLAESYGKSAVPDDGKRWLILPPEAFTLLVNASGIALHVDEVYRDLIGKGYMGNLLNFRLFKSTRLTGNNTDGYRVLAGHPSWMTFAEKALEVGLEEDLIGNFGSAYKDLFVYGAKVADPRRHFAAEAYVTF